MFFWMSFTILGIITSKVIFLFFPYLSSKFPKSAEKVPSKNIFEYIQNGYFNLPNS